MSARELGTQALKSGNAAEAVQLLSQAVRENPQDAQSHAYLGTAYAQLNQIDQAAECFREAARLAPGSAPIRFNLGMALEKAGKRDEALSCYREVLSLDASHERAQQALARLGGSAAPAPAPTVAPTNSILSEFAIGEPPPMPAAPPTPAPGSPLSAPPPPLQSAPPSPYGAPPSIYGTPPPAYGAPPAPYGGPPPAPAPMGGPMAMQPLGDWTPPPGAPVPPAPGQGQPAPPPQPHMGPEVTPGGAVMSRVDNDEGLSPSAFRGNSYLAGMGMGLWWGLIGAIVVFFSALMQIKSTEMGEHMPRLVVLCLMMIAGGALAYAVVGLIASTTDDPEKFGGFLGLGIGILTAFMLMPMVMASVGFYSIGGLFGTTWVSWKMGASVGAGVAEQQASALVIAGPGSVVVARTR